MSKKKLSKLLALYLPYVMIGLLATNLGEAWRLAVGEELGDKIVSLMGTLPAVFSNPLPSLHPFDLFIGLCCGAGMRLAVYLKGKNAKKYRHGMEYGSARWGGPKDIEPFMAPKFEDNIILTKTERLMMSNRPPDPKNARNKNVLVVGGSGSGKTRFFIKPNLLQCDSKNFPVSFVVTDPKGSIGVECGEALLKHGYKLKFFNTIDDILKGENKMDFTIFTKTEVEEMFQTMLEHMPENMRNIAIKEFGSIEQWKKHYMEVVSSEEMQKGYAKVVEWYGGKDKFLSVARTPVSKEVAESYNKRIEAILQKLIAKQNCDIDSFEVKELVGEYGFVMKQLAQIKEEKGFMMAQTQYYRNEQIKPMIDEKYGEGASDFFAQAIENYYKVK